MKSPIKTALVLCALALFALLVGLEAAARLLVSDACLTPPPPAEVDPQRPNPFMCWANPWGYVLIPGARYTQRIGDLRIAYAVNAQGFRGPAIPPHGALPRLIMLGDSFCEGHGSPWEETFVSRLARSEATNGWETINAGILGASPLYYAANLPRYLALRPDAVVVLLNDNDLWEDRVYATLHLQLPRLLAPDRLLAGHRPPLLEHSRAYRALQRWRTADQPSPVEQLMVQHALTDTPYPPGIDTPRQEHYLAQPGEFDLRWERSKAYLDMMADGFAAHGVALLVVQLSWRFQNPTLPPAFREQAQELTRRYAQWTQARGLPFLALNDPVYDAMTRHGYEALAIRDDDHPTPPGHELLAALLGPWLQRTLGDVLPQGPATPAAAAALPTTN
ncbi:SGNH/GDSL hydrolase family protein [Megalodesulfovibrio paquesii]